MKINVKQELTDTKNDQMREGIPPHMQGVLQNIFNEIENSLGEEKANELFEQIEKKQLIPPKMSLRDVLSRALMTGEGSRDTILKDWRLLKKIENEDEPDLDYQTCEGLIERVQKSFKGYSTNVVIVGRVAEMILEVHPDADKPDEKEQVVEKESPSKK